MLRCFPAFNVLDYNMLIKLQIIVEESLLNIAEEYFYYLSYPVIVLWSDTLVDLDDRFCNLALLTWWLNHSSLYSCHASFYVLDIPRDLHDMGFMFILVSLEEDLEFNVDRVYWLISFWWFWNLVGTFEVRATESLTLVLNQDIDHFDRKEVRSAWGYL